MNRLRGSSMLLLSLPLSLAGCPPEPPPRPSPSSSPTARRSTRELSRLPFGPSTQSINRQESPQR